MDPVIEVNVREIMVKKIIRGTKPVVGFGLIGPKAVIYFGGNVRTKTNWFVLSVIDAIVGFGLSGTKAKVFFCCMM